MQFALLQIGPTNIEIRLHQDIRPGNILAFRECLEPDEITAEIPEAFKFKLADLGLSHFVLATHGSNDMEADDTMGTQTYGENTMHAYTGIF
jgi:hypothetical protein